MIPLEIDLDVAPGAWANLEGLVPSDYPDTPSGGAVLPRIERVGLLRHGTTGGRATLTVVVRMPDGRAILAETTLRNAAVAARVIAASPLYAEEALP